MNRIGYHGTKLDITQFDIGYQGKGTGQYGSGFYSGRLKSHNHFEKSLLFEVIFFIQSKNHDLFLHT